MSTVTENLKNWVNGGSGDIDDDEEIGGPEQTIVEHLQELRSRLTLAVIGLVIGTVIGLIFSDQVFQLLTRPAGGIHLIYTEMTEGFTTYFKVAIMTGVALSSWWIFYQIFAFISPGLTRKERRMVVRFLPAVAALFLIGMAFAYFVVLPFAAHYLLSSFGQDATPLIKISNYIGFVTSIELWIGAAFETPLIIFILAKVGIVDVQRLSRYRKYALLGVFIIAAAITPTPDPFNQTLVAVPLYMLYELGLLFARFA